MVIKVGDVKPNSISRYKYKELPDQAEKWLSVNEYLPKDYDLCHLKLVTGKRKSGWFYRDKWDGFKLKPDDRIIEWKLQETEE